MKWRINKSEYLYKNPWLTVRKDEVITSKRIEIFDFYVLEYPTWVNVIAITDEGKFIIEQQYRHGIGKVFYELCAGKCEEGENPLDAAKRELLEETGFGGGEWSLIGKFAPNPNSMNNWCYSFLARGVKMIKPPNQEPTEDIKVYLFDRNKVFQLMKKNKIVEGVMLTPLWQYFYYELVNHNNYGIQNSII